MSQNVTTTTSAAILLLVIAANQLAAQDAPPPSIDDKNRITFFRSTPNAKSVLLSIEGKNAPIPMSKNENGLWSVTTDSLSADIYVYYFLIDGKPSDDPANKNRLPVVSGGSQGLIEIESATPAPWQQQNAPAGTIETVEYHSKIIGEQRSATVYLPPNYRKDDSSRFPVIYLLHGVFGDHQSWILAGRVHRILDNLIDSKVTEPMIVVMPFGYGFPNAERRVRQLFGPMDHKPWMEDFARSMSDELIPRIEVDYRIREDRDFHAVAGLSMGGAQALFIGISQPGYFGQIGSMSGAFTMFGGKPENFLQAALSTPPDRQPKIWLTCGTDDFVYEPNKKIINWLQQNDVGFTFDETTGGHEWRFWRRAFVRFVSKVFRK